MFLNGIFHRLAKPGLAACIAVACFLAVYALAPAVARAQDETVDLFDMEEATQDARQGLEIPEELETPDTAVAGDDFDIGESGGQSDEELAEQYYNQGVQLFMSSYFPQAIEFYKKAISLDPEMAAYHADLGEAYRVIGDSRAAISEFETAIKINPDMVNAYTTLGVIYERENLPQLAIKYHREAIALDPNHYIAYNNLGHTYDMLGLAKAAIENYREAIRINPDFAAAYDNLGTSLMRINRVDEGIEYIKKAIDIVGPDHPHVGLYYNDLGAAYAVMKQYEKSKAAFEEALKRFPDNQEILRNYTFIKEYLDGESN